MKAVLFENVPDNLEARKSGSPTGTRIMGASVYQYAAAKALLTYGTYDAYYFLQRNTLSAAKTENARTLEAIDPRARVITIDDLSSLAGIEDVVLMTGGAVFQGLRSIRAHLKRPDWPIVGATASLNGPILLPAFLCSLLDPVGHDALVCSTDAGRRVVQNQMRHLSGQLQRVSGITAKQPFRLPVIPMGIDAQDFQHVSRKNAREALQVPDDTFVLLCLGRFSSTSKCDLRPLVSMFISCLASRFPCVLVLAGDDTQEHDAKSLAGFAQRLGGGASVILRPDPSTETKQELLAAADIFVAPSDHLQETFGIGIAEAMAAGLPVVAADWNGYKELVSHGETGFLIPTYMPRYGHNLGLFSAMGSLLGDALLAQTTTVDLGAMAEYLAIVIENATLRANMGANARRMAARLYDWTVIVASYEKLWFELLAEGKSVKATVHDSPVHGFASYDYLDVFSHYPTRCFEDYDTLRLSAIGRRWLEDSELFDLMIDRRAMFGAEALREIARMLSAENSPVSMVDLVYSVRQRTGSTELAARLHVGRLIKYGIFTLDNHPQKFECPSEVADMAFLNCRME